MPLAHTTHEVTLQNGAKGLLIDVPGVPTVYYSLTFRAGHLYRGDAPFEAPHLLEHLLFSMSSAYPSQAAFRKDLTRHAAWSNAYTNVRNVSHVGDAVLSDWLRVLSLRTVAITEPSLDEVAIASEQGNVKEELSRNLTNTERIAYYGIARELGVPDLGDAARIKLLDQPITRDALQAYYVATYTMRNMRFVIAGDLQTVQSDALAMLEGWTLPAGERLPLADVTLRPGRHSLIIPEGTTSGSWLRIGLGIQRLLTPHESVTMGMLLRFLCSGMRSRILTRARDLGICYQMQGYVSEYGKDATIWMISAPASVANLPALLDVIGEEFARFVADGISEAELEAEKDYARGLWFKSGQTPEQLVAMYDQEFVEHDRVRHYAAESEDIDAVTAEDMHALAQAFMTSGISASVAVTKSTDQSISAALDAFHERLDGVH